MHGPLVEAAIRSANAWVGDSRRRDSSDRYDENVWARESQEDPAWDPEEAVLLYEEPDFDIYEVIGNIHSRPWEESFIHELAPRMNKEVFNPKTFYPNAGSKKEISGAKILMFVFGDRDERDLKSALGEPPVDGYLLGLFVLSGPDRLIPLSLYWRGRELNKQELSERIQKAIEVTSRLPMHPKVPAPALPPDLEEEIKRAIDQSARRRDHELAERLLELDRSTFLEALDRMIPWIDDGQLAWIDKDDDIADRLWKILCEFPKMSGGKLKTAPWKTGFGTPRRMYFRVDQDSNGSLAWGEKSVMVHRTPQGTYQVR